MRLILYKLLSRFFATNSYEVYTDGSCKRGRGGWAFVVIRNQKVLFEKSGFALKTGSNRMELLAAIEALKSLPTSSKITLYSDSRILVDSLILWVPRWKAQGWLKKNSKQIPNVDLFMALDSLNQMHSVTWKWVRAHAGNPYNERCDELCGQARLRGF